MRYICSTLSILLLASSDGTVAQGESSRFLRRLGDSSFRSALRHLLLDGQRDLQEEMPTSSPAPSPSPSMSPTVKPPSSAPTESPVPSPSPSMTPTLSKAPTPKPTFGTPSASPAPTGPTDAPSSSPAPSPSPSAAPSMSPPTTTPTSSPKPSPSPSGLTPTLFPSVSPAPSTSPSGSPAPSPSPSKMPTPSPTKAPTISGAPSVGPSASPEPSPSPSNTPSVSTGPSMSSNAPSVTPTVSNEPSKSDLPSVTTFPSLSPSVSQAPSVTDVPSSTPSVSNVPSVTDVPTVTSPFLGETVTARAPSTTTTTASVPGAAEITFPVGTFSSPATVTVTITNDPVVQESLDALTDIFNPSDVLNYEVRVSVTAAPNGAVPYTMTVPSYFSDLVNAGNTVEALVTVSQGGTGLDPFFTFELIPSTFTSSTGEISFSIPADAFTELTPGSSDFQAIITLMISPGDQPTNRRRLQEFHRYLQATSCDAAGIQCPLGVGGCVVGNAFTRALDNPGGGTNLNGVTFIAATGTNVYAATPGNVVFASVNSVYGNTVILDTGGAFRTLYGFMDSIAVASGDTVVPGDLIGTVGTTGQAIDPQLYFEYAPRGSIFLDKFRIDGNVCLGGGTSGDIVVSSAANHYFAVFINGLLVGHTTSGLPTLGISNLISGDKSLTIVVLSPMVTAASFTLRLNGGLTFQDDGSVVKTETTEMVMLATGDSLTRVIGIPEIVQPLSPTASLSPSTSAVPSTNPLP